MSRLNDDYDVPDPVGAAWDRLVAWRNDNPVKVEGCVAAAALVAPWVIDFGGMWSWSTANLDWFGALYGGALAIWTLRWELREQAIQEQLSNLWPHVLRWVMPPDSDDPNDGRLVVDLDIEPTRSATEVTDEALADLHEEVWA